LLNLINITARVYKFRLTEVNFISGFTLIVIYFAATLRPSLPGSLYFLMFIIAETNWALYRQLHR